MAKAKTSKPANDFMADYDKTWQKPKAASKQKTLFPEAKPKGANSPTKTVVPKTTSSASYKRCFHDHPPLPLGDGLVVYGGSCSDPVVKDADIYVGLQSGMRLTGGQYPWNPLIEVEYPITDMNPPKDAVTFKQLIVWMAEQIKAGKKVHVGCIGGHGRTGTVFSALVKHMTGNADATAYVREHYCKKAVEAKSQVDFLEKEWGINRVEPAKVYTPAPYSSSSYSSGSKSQGFNGWNGGASAGGQSFAPLKHDKNLYAWNRKILASSQ